MNQTHWMGGLGILMCLVCLLACTSQMDEDSFSPSVGQAEVTLQIATRAGQVSDLEAPEYQLQTLHIYVFNRENKLVGFAQQDLGNTPQHTATVKMKLPYGYLQFYTLANVEKAGPLKKNNGEAFTLPTPIGTSVPELQQVALTPGDLKSLTFATLPQAELTSNNPTEMDEHKRTYRGAVLPMVSEKTNVQVSTNSVITVELTRSVAKLSLYFSKLGVKTDIAYLGRGLYLYNVPEYGYLFPGTKYGGEFKHVEDDQGEHSDSELNQKGGQVILRCGWPQEPEKLEPGHHPELDQTHINEIRKFNNTPGGDEDMARFEAIPHKPVYLFANPNQVQGPVGHIPGKPVGQAAGYYLKIMAHIHRNNQDGPEVTPPRKLFYVSLPAVQANDHVEVFSTLVVDGFIDIVPHWKITPWKTGGADIEFN